MLEDTRVSGYDPLISPVLLQFEIPCSELASQTISLARSEVSAIIQGKSNKLLVIVGPCSIHDTDSALEYAKKLKEYAASCPELFIVMRTYFEKPRTTVGWKGLINDPNLDGSFDINAGLKKARKLLVQINELGLPCGFELLDTISPQFLADTVSWGAIGARTTESQLHRELASGVSFPVGFKNGTDGSIDIAMDAINAASHPHFFLGINKQGLASITKTNGNSDCHIILRGGKQGTNYDSVSISNAEGSLSNNKLPARIMVDFSHGNSLKKHKNQILVCDSVADQIKSGNTSIIGVMIESNLNEGNQKLTSITDLKSGVSITDACVHWEDTVIMLDRLAKALSARN